MADDLQGGKLQSEVAGPGLGICGEDAWGMLPFLELSPSLPRALFCTPVQLYRYGHVGWERW